MCSVAPAAKGEGRTTAPPACAAPGAGSSARVPVRRRKRRRADAAGGSAAGGAGAAKPAVQGGAGARFGEFAVVERELGEPGLAVAEPHDDFGDQQAGLVGGNFGEGEGAEGDRAGAGAVHRVLDVRLQDQVAPPDVRLQEPLGAGGGEPGDLAEADEPGLAAGPAEDIVPDQKRRQAPGESFGIEGDCQGRGTCSS